MTQATKPQEHPSHNDIICSHLYNMGYIKGLYADLVLRISSPFQTVDGIIFKIHRILAIKSPYLQELLNEVDNEYQPTASLVLQVNDPHITPEGLGIAIGHLYASYSASILKNTLSNQRANLLKSVLCSASLLRLGDLAHLATEMMKSDVSVSTVVIYTNFVVSDKDYGTASQEMKDCIFDFLCHGVTKEMKNPWDKEGEDYRLLTQVFMNLPFEWLKRVIESQAFLVPSEMERFTFAKKVVALRSASKAHSGRLVAGEENVLLSFGNTGNSGVTLVRKTPKNPPVGNNNATSVQAFGHERKVWKADIGF